MGISYKDAGVDITAGNVAVERMKAHVKRTQRPGVVGGLGGFGGLFSLDIKKYTDPVLVSGTDGVGTKLRVAFLTGKHDTIGIDAVAMCVNDILVQGAEPLFFLDYLAVGKLDPGQVEDIVAGIAEGCCQAGCALIGGETAEMPGFYPPGDYDVAGFCVGVVNRDKIIDGSTIAGGDLLLGLPSSGLHSNGFSLARKVLLEVAGFTVGEFIPELGRTLGEELLVPTQIYVKQVLPLVSEGLVKGMAHITGGGLVENLPRVLPEGMGAEIDRSTWQPPAVFKLIQDVGGVNDLEMLRTFNMGIGMVLVIAEENLARAQELLSTAQQTSVVIGKITPGTKEVRFTGQVQE
ncbi:MAG TPA: phosphoribosylformylglycinamidine cyclo-ligase [Candidatus Deferrimicrobium sp.]|nr:phosphoribosylformylglycinamidine cyclo-ligase [Candidatus Deferrimicrobium sp.]